MNRFVFFFSLALVASLPPTSASAQPSEADQRARLHFQSGRSYFEEGAYERALQEFQQAYELSPRTPMLFNIGTTLERLGRLEEAAGTFERYLSQTEGVPADDRRVLERRIANLRRRAAEQQRPTPTADPADPTDAPSTDPATEPSPAGGGAGEGLIIGGAVGLGVAGAALISFGVLGGLALSEQSAVESGCFASRSCTAEDVSSMDGFALGADISWITAAVAGTAGAVLLLLGLTAEGGDDAMAWRLSPLGGPTSAGLALDGSF